MRSSIRLLFATSIVLLGIGYPASAQLALGPLQINGSVGFSARGYMAGGIANRRAPAVAEAFANVGFNLWGLSSGFNLAYSSEDSRLRQSMNRIGLNTAWDWGQAAVGDVSPSYSRYSLRGITLRGASVELTPGNVIFALAAGSARRPVEFNPLEGFRETSYRRMLYAGRIGYGRERGTHAHLVTVYARDLVSSIDEPGEAQPKENVSFAPDLGLSLFDGRFYVGSQVTFSAFTPDTRNDPLTALDLPGFISNLFTPRVGTFVSYAGDAEAQLDLSRFDLSVAYSRVHPGFASLGVGRIRSDQASIRIEPRVLLLDRRVRLGVSLAQSRNNLQDQLISTLTNRRVGARVQARISQGFSISSQYMRLASTNEPGPDARDPVALHQQQIAQTFMVAPLLILPAGEYLHTVALTGTHQLTRDRSNAVRQGLREGVKSDNTTATLTYSLRFPSGFAVNTTGNVLYGTTAASDIMVFGLNAGTGLRLLDEMLALSLNAGWSLSQTQFEVQDVLTLRRAMQFTAGAGASFRLNARNSLRLRVTGLANRLSSGGGSSFSELRAVAQYQYRF